VSKLCGRMYINNYKVKKYIYLYIYDGVPRGSAQLGQGCSRGVTKNGRQLCRRVYINTNKGGEKIK